MRQLAMDLQKDQIAKAKTPAQLGYTNLFTVTDQTNLEVNPLSVASPRGKPC